MAAHLQARLILALAGRLPCLRQLAFGMSLEGMRKASKDCAWLLQRLAECCPQLEVVGGEGASDDEDY